MNQIEITISIESRASIDIGKSGENLVQRVLFDVSPWLEQYGTGASFAMVFERPDGKVYPMPSTLEGNCCTVTISRTYKPFLIAAHYDGGPSLATTPPAPATAKAISSLILLAPRPMRLEC